MFDTSDSLGLSSSSEEKPSVIAKAAGMFWAMTGSYSEESLFGEVWRPTTGKTQPWGAGEAPSGERLGDWCSHKLCLLSAF